MKTDSELLKSANEIKGETSKGKNDAPRVGGHLADMVKRLGRADIKTPDSNAPYKATVPVVTFKYDDIAGDHSLWPEHFQAYSTARVAAGKHANIDNAPDIPGTLCFPSEWPKTTTALLTASTLTCDADTRTITDSNPPAGGLDSIFEWNMVISIVSAGANNGKYFVIQSVTADTITLYASAPDWCQALLDESGHEISIYRGKQNTSTWAQIAEAITLGWTVAGHGRTHRALGARSGFTTPTDAEMWDELYTSRINLNAKLLELTGNVHDVRHMVVPFGGMYDKTPQFIRQAGWHSCNAYSYSGTEASNDHEFMRGAIDPFHIDEENSHVLIDTGNALDGTVTISAAGTTVTGSGTEFLTDLAEDDIIAISNMIWQERVVASVTNGTGLELTVAPKQTATGCRIYVNGVIITGTASITAGSTTVTGAGTDFTTDVEGGDTIRISKYTVDTVFQVRRISAEVVSDTSLTVDTAFGADAIAAEGYIYKCSTETAGNGFDIGNINYISANNGWYQVAQHVPYGTQAQFNRSPYAAILDYIDYLNEDGADIVIRDRDAAYEIYRPLLEAGTAFAVSHDSVMIRRAKSRNFTIDEDGGMVLGAPIAYWKVADEDITENRFTVWLNEDGNKLMFRVKYSDGTIKSGSIALT